jgi:hypothetical protein
MNERIKRILEQADISMSMTEFSGCLEGQDYLVADSNLSEMQLEKFAELLISEVMKVVRDEVQYEYDWALADIVTERVKKEFGV